MLKFNFIFVVSITLCLCFRITKGQESDPLPVVAVIITGGTIVQVDDSKGRASIPSSDSADIVKQAALGLSSIVDIEVHSFSNIDSSQMTPHIWVKLSEKVDEILSNPKIAGVVVVHGTDTMAEAAYFLDLNLKSKKSVVFTGAMRNASDPNSDGPFNLQNAIIQAASKDANWGVTLTMNQMIQSPRAVRKTYTNNVQTFESGDEGILGFVFNNKVHRVNERLNLQKFPMPKRLAKVDVFLDYSGASGDVLRFLVDSGADGIVIDSMGAGNVNKPVFEAIQYALKKNVVIVISTSVYYGGVFPIYGGPGGGETLQQIGAVFSGNLTSKKARLFLMLALPYFKGNTSQLQKAFDSV